MGGALAFFFPGAKQAESGNINNNASNSAMTARRGNVKTAGVETKNVMVTQKYGGRGDDNAFQRDKKRSCRGIPRTALDQGADQSPARSPAVCHSTVTLGRDCP
jgi:hypothetical protein